MSDDSKQNQDPSLSGSSGGEETPSNPDPSPGDKEIFPALRPGLSCVITGGTGAIGRCLVGETLGHGWRVWTVGRRPITTQELETAGYEGLDVKVAEEEGRLIQLNIDFDAIDSEASAQIFQQIGQVPVHFSALGTTRKDAGSAAKFREIDFGYVAKMAEYSKEYNNLRNFSLVSSVGANPNSWFLYPQVKGEIEQHIIGLKFQTTDIWRPGLLGRQDKARWNEKLASWLMSPMPVSRVAKAMRLQAEERILAAQGQQDPAIPEGEEGKSAEPAEDEPVVTIHPNKSINAIVDAAASKV